ncbi:MAG: Flp family type IVb pilin [Sphingomicrobium sp.]
MTAIRNALRAIASDESGATAIEYGLIAAFLGVGLVGALSALGGGTEGMWTNLANILSVKLL